MTVTSSQTIAKEINKVKVMTDRLKKLKSEWEEATADVYVDDTILFTQSWKETEGLPIDLRVPLVPGLNDSDEEITGIAQTVASITKSSKVNLLPYHRFGISKYKMLDLEYKLPELANPTDEKLQRAKKL